MNKHVPSAPIPQSGFTLLEMLIALSIVVLLSGITVESVMKSRSQTALNQTAQEIVLRIREVQQKGISVSAVQVTSSGGTTRTFYPSHGVRFNISNATEQKKITIFPDLPTSKTDSDGDGVADSIEIGNIRMDGNGQQWREDTIPPAVVYNLNPRVFISAVKYDNGIAGGANVQNNILHVIYHRPDPTVYFTRNNGQDDLNTQHAWICLATTDGSNLKRKIDIWKTGQVSLATSGGAAGDCP